ncbi:hypothetical protein [Vibrio paucivorans]|uniref:Uncharacterized protein n=1 Tax=Vibrio paucivorans TaxID=2829489 RepID=A0A9X3HR15_9VIBR|nr:hypothetical protein [Vibrio paucivorans]MCW8333624.1 hypothetical protein [Vibrio paucivorans]
MLISFKTKTINWEDFLALFFCIIVYLFSMYTGKLSPDSANYLIMATPSVDGYLCQYNGELWGVYACGYSVLIYALDLLSGLGSYESSKLLNVLVLFFLYLVFSHIFESKKLSLLLTFTPFNILIAFFTWSENVVILSFAIYILVLMRAKSKEKLDLVTYVGVFVAIIIGCFSRFAFAPFSVVLFLAGFTLLGKKNLRIFPVFLVCALLFVVYKYFASFNDMERLIAPESFDWLLYSFFTFVSVYTFKHITLLIPLLFTRKTRSFKTNIQTKNRNWFLFFAVCGLGYLMISLTMRAIVHYDFYNVRTVGFGVSLLYSSSLIYLYDRLGVWSKKHLLVYFLLMQLVFTIFNPHAVKNIFEGKYKELEYINNLIEKQQHTRDSISITFGRFDDSRVPGTSIKRFNLENPNTFIRGIPGAPYARKLDIDEFRELLDGSSCQLYFPPDYTLAQLEQRLYQKYKVGFDEYILKYDEELIEFFIQKFITGDNSCY